MHLEDNYLVMLLLDLAASSLEFTISWFLITLYTCYINVKHHVKNIRKKYIYIFSIKFPSACCCCCFWVASVVSNSAWPHRRQHTRLPRPWDSPGKNTGVGCHFLFQCMKVKVKLLSRVQLSDPMDCSLPGCSIRGIFQTRVLEWVTTDFSLPVPR